MPKRSTVTAGASPHVENDITATQSTDLESEGALPHANDTSSSEDSS